MTILYKLDNDFTAQIKDDFEIINILKNKKIIRAIVPRKLAKFDNPKYIFQKKNKLCIYTREFHIIYCKKINKYMITYYLKDNELKEYDDLSKDEYIDKYLDEKEWNIDQNNFFNEKDILIIC